MLSHNPDSADLPGWGGYAAGFSAVIRTAASASRPFSAADSACSQRTIYGRSVRSGRKPLDVHQPRRRSPDAGAVQRTARSSPCSNCRRRRLSIPFMAVHVATIGDIVRMHEIRTAVHENRLCESRSHPAEDHAAMLNVDGRGWVFEQDGVLAGFGIADGVRRNIWARSSRQASSVRALGGRYWRR